MAPLPSTLCTVRGEGLLTLDVHGTSFDVRDEPFGVMGLCGDRYLYDDAESNITGPSARCYPTITFPRPGMTSNPCSPRCFCPFTQFPRPLWFRPCGALFARQSPSCFPPLALQILPEREPRLCHSNCADAAVCWILVKQEGREVCALCLQELGFRVRMQLLGTLFL